MSGRPDIVSRNKSSSHKLTPGRFYDGIVTAVLSNGKINVTIPTLGTKFGPLMPLNTTATNTYVVNDTVKCAFADEFFNDIIVFGSTRVKSDVFTPTEYGISRYATAVDRDTAVPSPSEGHCVYILETDELQVYNGNSWVTIVDAGAAGNLSINTLIVSGQTTLSSSTSIGTVNATQLSYLSGVSSNIQTQLNAKSPTASPTFTGTVTLPSSTSIGSVSSTELGFIDGVSSNIQTQLDAKVPLTQTIRSVTASSDAPSSADNGKIVVIDTSSGAVTITINGSLGLSAGQQINFVWQGAATSVTFSASGLTGGSLNGTPGTKLRTRYSAASLLCTASNTYILIGDLAA